MAYLLLSNGKYFEGKRFGAKKDSVGEVVFTTGVVGYLETLTDPAYAGQIIVQTFPLIGNYGVISSDLKGRCFASGYVVRELSKTPSNFRSEGTLEEYLEKEGICGIEGIDTRELTRILREEGTMNGIICDTLPKDTAFLKEYSVKEKALETGCKNETVFEAQGEEKYSVAVIDMGSGTDVAKALSSLGVKAVLMPCGTKAERILYGGFDGAVLSDGAGSPYDCESVVSEVGRLLGNITLLGISLGHQLIAMSQGAKAYKLKKGHRGSQPVKVVGGTRTLITNQNHGYAVDGESLEGLGKVIYVNANDGTVEGAEYKYSSKKCFTVQFLPTGRDGAFVYDRFIKLMGGEGNAER